MKTVLITVAIVEVFQIIGLFGALMADMSSNDYGQNEEKFLTTKRRVLQFFIPFFWFIPMVNNIMRWWNKLK